MWPNPQKTADLVRFTEEILNGKLHFLLCAVYRRNQLKSQLVISQTQYKSEHFMDTTTDYHFHSVQTRNCCLKIKFIQLTSKTKTCNTDFKFGPRDFGTFFIDKCQQSSKDENLEESLFKQKRSLDISFRVTSDDYLSDGSIIYSCEGRH